jgi:putative transposase
MARPLRLEWPGMLYHVTSRGDRREPIVEDDEDRAAWVAVLGQACGRFGWRVHAWCLMTNHYHLLLETPSGQLAAGMRHLNGVESQRFNRRHGRVGRVFRGRYKAIIVERESYLLELARYVVLNPVRAGMVAVAGYVDFVRAGVGLASVWERLRGQVFLGCDTFVERMTAAFDADDPKLRDVPQLQRRPSRRGSTIPTASNPAAEIATRAETDAAMVAVYAAGGHTLRAIADAFGVHEATVSRALRRHAAPVPTMEARLQ